MGQIGLDNLVSKLSLSEALLHFTLFASMLCLGAFAVFFLSEKERIVEKYRGTMTTSAMICGVAAVAYYFLTKNYRPDQPFPTAIRYVDWMVTTPLLLVKFQEMLKPRGIGFVSKLIVADLFMIVTGFIGELFGSTVHGQWNGDSSNAVSAHYLWGAISTLGYVYIVVALLTEGRRLIAQAPAHIGAGARTMTRYVLIGWGIYPIAYILEGLSASHPEWSINLDWSNVASGIGDVVNKVLFGVTAYLALRASGAEAIDDPSRADIARA